MTMQSMIWGIAVGAGLGAAFMVASYVSFLVERRRSARRMFDEFGPLPHMLEQRMPANVISLADYRARDTEYRIVDEATARAMHPSMRGMQASHLRNGRA